MRGRSDYTRSLRSVQIAIVRCPARDVCAPELGLVGSPGKMAAPVDVPSFRLTCDDGVHEAGGAWGPARALHAGLAARSDHRDWRLLHAGIRRIFLIYISS
jgi:hypothetical protein